MVAVEPAGSVHVPVPTAGVLAAMVKVVVLHFVWLGPAVAVGSTSFLSTTISLVVQVPFVMVHTAFTVTPAGTLIVVVVLFTFPVMVAPVPTTGVSVHVPVPTEAALAAIVKEGVLHLDWSGPALAGVGAAKFVITTSSVEEQTPLVIVQRSVTVVPAGTLIAAVLLFT